jgi:hypothetical protein
MSCTQVKYLRNIDYDNIYIPTSQHKCDPILYDNATSTILNGTKSRYNIDSDQQSTTIKCVNQDGSSSDKIIPAFTYKETNTIVCPVGGWCYNNDNKKLLNINTNNLLTNNDDGSYTVNINTSNNKLHSYSSDNDVPILDLCREPTQSTQSTSLTPLQCPSLNDRKLGPAFTYKNCKDVEYDNKFISLFSDPRFGTVETDNPVYIKCPKTDPLLNDTFLQAYIARPPERPDGKPETRKLLCPIGGYCLQFSTGQQLLHDPEYLDNPHSKIKKDDKGYYIPSDFRIILPNDTDVQISKEDIDKVPNVMISSLCS